MPAFSQQRGRRPGSWLLDIRNGSTRQIDGRAHRWHGRPAGRQALLVKFGDGTSAAPQSPDLRLVDIPSGHISWHVNPFPPARPPMRTSPQRMSPDGSQVAVQEDDSYSIRNAQRIGQRRSRSLAPRSPAPTHGRRTVSGLGTADQSRRASRSTRPGTGALTRKLPTVDPRPGFFPWSPG